MRGTIDRRLQNLLHRLRVIFGHLKNTLQALLLAHFGDELLAFFLQFELRRLSVIDIAD